MKTWKISWLWKGGNTILQNGFDWARLCGKENAFSIMSHDSTAFFGL